MTIVLKGKRVLVIGSGSFGLSSAISFAEHASRPASITVLDRSSIPGPNADAASHDLNKIVRSDYSDPMYAELGLKAMEEWRKPIFSETYHEAGLLMIALSEDNPRVINDSLAVNEAFYKRGQLHSRPVKFDTVEAIRAILPEEGNAIPSTEASGYLNPCSGWVAAADAMQTLAKKAVGLGIRFEQGEAQSIDHSEPVVRVDLVDGRTLEADLVIVAAGAWTPRIFPQLQREYGLVPVGYFLAAIQLTPEELPKYRMPVVLRYLNGLYMFMPDKHGLLKFSIHGPAFTNNVDGIGLPRTQQGYGGGTAEDTIPLTCALLLREELARIFPELAKRDFAFTRLCWDCETPDSHWIIDYLVEAKHGNVLVATGGSGHAFKMTPILGDLVLSRIQGTLTKEQDRRFSLKGMRERTHGEQADAFASDVWPKRLQEHRFATQEELKGSLPH